MADQQWQVESVTPTPTPPPTPPPPQPGGDQWQVDSVTPTAPPPDPRQQALTNLTFNPRRDWEKVKGFAKDAARTGAGLLDLANTPMAPTATPGQALPEIKHLTDKVRARTQLTNPDQESGGFVESALEFLPMMEEEAPGMMKNLAEKYNVGADLAKFAQKYPKIAAAWNVMMEGTKAAVRGGAEQGGQTYLKTGGDVAATTEAAKTGAEFAGVAGAGASAAGETSNLIKAGRPGARTVAGAKFETNPKTGKPILRNLEEVPQDPATQAVDEAMGNIAKTGVANSLNRANASRPVGMAQETNPARMLQPPEGSAQGFQVGTTPPREVGQPPQTATVTEQTGTQTVPNPQYEAPAGELTRQPGQTAEQTAEEIGAGATAATPQRSYAGPGDVDTRNATQKRIDAARGLVPERMLVPPETTEQPVYQQRPVTTQPQKAVTTHPERATEMQPDTQRIGGGGPLILTSDGQATSVQRARQQLAQYKKILGDPDEVAEMGVRQHQAMVNAHDDLAGQLDRYDNYAASQPHFAPHDPVEAVRNTDDLGDAAEQLKAAHAPFWRAADQASGNQFTKLREREKWLQARLNSKNPIGNYDDLSAELEQNQNDQMAFFDKYRNTVSPQEWQTARSGYQDGIVLGNLNDMLQRKFGGISRELEQRGMTTGNQRQRVFQPTKNFNQELEDFYNNGNNRDVLQRTIGQDHMDSLHDLGLMFSSTDRMDKTQGLMQSIMTSIRHHYHGVRGMLAGGAGVGMLAAHQAGMELAKSGAVAGAGLSIPILTGTASGINRYITNKLITDPSFLKTFSYALDKVPARTAGPLLAARIIAQLKNAPLKQQTKQPPPQEPQ